MRASFVRKARLPSSQTRCYVFAPASWIPANPRHMHSRLTLIVPFRLTYMTATTEQKNGDQRSYADVIPKDASPSSKTISISNAASILCLGPNGGSFLKPPLSSRGKPHGEHLINRSNCLWWAEFQQAISQHHLKRTRVKLVAQRTAWKIRKASALAVLTNLPTR